MIIEAAISDSPSPSRRKAGSISLAPRPIPLVAPPATCARPVQPRASVRPIAPKARGTGPAFTGLDLPRAGALRFTLRFGVLFVLLGEDPRVRVDVREAIVGSVPNQRAIPLQSHASRVSHIDGRTYSWPPLIPITTGTIMGRRR